jgi:hypothetical protein
MSRPVTRFPHDGCRFLAARRTLLRNLCRQNVSDVGSSCVYRLREALARSCGFFLWLALIRSAIWRALLHWGWGSGPCPQSVGTVKESPPTTCGIRI